MSKAAASAELGQASLDRVRGVRVSVLCSLMCLHPADTEKRYCSLQRDLWLHSDA